MAIPAIANGTGHRPPGGERCFRYRSQAGSAVFEGAAKRENCAAKPSRNAGRSKTVYGAPIRNHKAAAPAMAPSFLSRSGDERSPTSQAATTATRAMPPLYLAAAASPAAAPAEA